MGAEPSDEEGRGFEKEALDVVREWFGPRHDSLDEGQLVIAGISAYVCEIMRFNFWTPCLKYMNVN
jgi:hypothetical protein